MDTEKAYKLYKKVNKIEGWFSFEAAMLFAMLDEIQKMNQITGDIFEIGIHHGRSTLFIAGMINDQDESLQACDLFRSQELNQSGSGNGNRKVFEKNSKNLFPNLDIYIHEKSSSDLNPDDIGIRYRIFHIDGGHSYQETFSDLNLAANSIVKNGLIIIDDPMTYVWPGVIQGIFEFLIKNKDFVGIIAGFNKMVLVKKEFAEIYTSNFEDKKLINEYELGYPYQFKKLPFLDFELGIIFLPSGINLNSLKTQVFKYIKKNNLQESQTFLKTIYRLKKAKSHMITEDLEKTK